MLLYYVVEQVRINIGLVLLVETLQCFVTNSANSRSKTLYGETVYLTSPN